MDFQEILSPWSTEEAKKVNENFKEMEDREGEIVATVLSRNTAAGAPQINGLFRPTEMDFRYLDNTGINFTANKTGFLYRTWIYAGYTANLGIGLAIQPIPNQSITEEVCYKVVPLRWGWNHVELNFPVEKGVRYTLFKRNVSEPAMATNTTLLSGWSTNSNLHNNGLKFHCGAALAGGGTMSNYNTFYEIELISTLPQLYKIRDEKFYVGDNPPTEAKYWFRPFGG